MKDFTSSSNVHSPRSKKLILEKMQMMNLHSKKRGMSSPKSPGPLYKEYTITQGSTGDSVADKKGKDIKLNSF